MSEFGYVINIGANIDDYPVPGKKITNNFRAGYNGYTIADSASGWYDANGNKLEKNAVFQMEGAYYLKLTLNPTIATGFREITPDVLKKIRIGFKSGKSYYDYDTKKQFVDVRAGKLNSDGTIRIDGEETAQITMKDAPTEVSITKVDDRAGAPLSGVLLQILKDGKVVDEWTTSGTAHLVTHLETGVVYQLHEVSAPGGYEPGEDVSFLIDVYGKVTMALGQDEDGSFVLPNTYHAAGSITPAGVKTLTGRQLADKQFTFEVYEVKEAADEAGDKESPTTEELIQTVMNDAEGKIAFEPLSFELEDVGTHTYKIREKAADAPGYTYSEKEYTLVLEVTDNGDGTLAVTPAEGSDMPDALDFTNSYRAEGSIVFSGSKKLKGGELKDGQFKFELLDEEGEVLEEVSNKADGSFAFKEISFTEEDLGQHKYIVREINDKQEGYKYDSTQYELLIEVTDNGDGTLKVEAAAGGQDPSALVFNNEKEKAPDADNAAIKPDKPGTGDSGNRLPWLCLLAAGAALGRGAAGQRPQRGEEDDCRA